MSLTVIMSTYNPNPDYLKSQVKSIVDQTYSSTIYIRDDGSTKEESVKALNEVAKFDAVTVERGKNLGFQAGFLTALKNCPTADYYAFSDQDDFWLPSKNSRAVEELDNKGAATSDLPYLWASHFDFCDADLKLQESQGQNPYGHTFANALTEAAVPGFVMTFNGAMRDMLLMLDPSRIPGHDWAAYAISTAYGTFIEDQSVQALYRRHGNNVSEGNEKGLKLFAFRLKSFLLTDGLSRLRSMYLELYRVLGDKLKKKDKELLKSLCDWSFLGRCKKVVKPTRYRRTLPADLSARFMFLIGRI